MDHTYTPNTPIAWKSTHNEKRISTLESLKFFLQTKSIQLALLTALGGSWGLAAHNISTNNEKNEQSIEKESYPFPRHHLDFWDNDTTFFDKNLQPKKETLAPGVEIVRDARMTFYVVQKEDFKETKDTTYTSKTVKSKHWKKSARTIVKIPHITIHKEWDFDGIRSKLGTLQEFSYLCEDEYNHKLKSFNIPKEYLQPGMHIPIPLDHKVREISPQDFGNYCYEAIQEMKKDSNAYSKQFKEFLSSISEKDLITDMVAFARSETASECTRFIKPIGEVELHRREQLFQAFSFSYFHILMEKNSNGSSGPGLTARLKLGFTEGQCYHPKNAAKLFLAYRIEKNHGNLKSIFPITDNNVEKVGKTYNGWSAYAKKLKLNYEYAEKLIKWEIVYYEDTNLTKKWFIYKGLNSQYDHIYLFAIPDSIKNTDTLKQFVIEEFNKNKSNDCPSIDKKSIVTQLWKDFPECSITDTVCVRVPHFPNK